MSDHKHDNEPGNGLVEAAGVKAKPVLVFLAVLGAATAMVYVIIWGVEIGLKKFDEMNPQQPATAIQTGTKLPPEPRLQGAPEPNPDKPGETRNSLLPLDDMAVYGQKVNKQISSYGWVDEKGGVAHIPIERAKEIIAEKGLPALSEALAGEVRSAEAARKLVMNAGANGGRSIKSQKQVTAPAAEAPKPVAAQPAETKPAAVPAAGAKH
ncbi:MAG: hypothetical protein ACKVZH_09935 [Blastocatellia bacterium]